MGRLYRLLKSRLNSLLEQLIHPCNRLLLGYYRLPAFLPRSWLECLVRFIGDLIWLIVTFPRIPVYRYDHNGWIVLFVGNEKREKWFRLSFFENPPPFDEVQDGGRVKLWQIPYHVREWLKGDIDLVVCELGRLFPWYPSAPVAFAVPTSVTQIMEIPDSLENLLSGNKRKSIRARVNKARADGFDYRFSHSEADFDFFHHKLYKPYIQHQHGELALMGSYNDQLRLFKRGGLLLVTLNGESVGGSVGFLAGDTYMDVEGGYLHEDERLQKHGINAFINWSAIQWGNQNGAKVYDIGMSNSWRSDGVFTFKRRWGTKVIRPKIIYQRWVFLAHDLSDELRDHMNKMGFIGELHGKFYGVRVEQQPHSGEALRQVQADWADEGVDGIWIVSPGRPADIYPILTTEQPA